MPVQKDQVVFRLTLAIIAGSIFFHCSLRERGPMEPGDIDPGPTGDPGPLVWKSTGGPNAGKVTCLEADSRGAVFAGTKNGAVYQTTNRGLTWRSFSGNLPGTPIHALMVAPGRQLFAATDSAGLYRTSLDSINWIPANLNDTTAYSLAVNSQGALFAGTAAGVFRLLANGMRWEQKNAGLESVKVISFDINADDKLFAGTAQNGIFTSADNGETWEQNTLMIGRILDISLNLHNHIYVATQGIGAFISETNGNTWTVPNSGFTPDTVYSFAFNSAHTAFASGRGSGVLRSSDMGFNWEPFNDSLSSTMVLSLAVDHQDFLFAGTEAGIVYRTSKSTVAPGD